METGFAIRIMRKQSHCITSRQGNLLFAASRLGRTRGQRRGNALLRSFLLQTPSLKNHVDWVWLCTGRFSSKIESSTIQVSLVPPPWLELTTSDLSFKATLVNPPGTTRMPFAPVRTKGRKSTCRGAMPASKKAGVVESASVG